MLLSSQLTLAKASGGFVEQKKRYSREEVLRVMKDLFATIQARKDLLDVPHQFINEHPWTLKYLSHFSEADSLLEVCKSEHARIVEAPWTENIQKFRAERGYKLQLRFRIFAPWCPGTYSRWLFVFEEQEDGTFVPLNG